MEFRILGPLELRTAAGPVPVRGRHQPKLLAMLLLEAGHVVPLHRLIEALWDDVPPDTARRQTQNAMAALRRALAAAGTDPVEAVGEGYRITCEHLDARKFADGVRRARALMGQRDHRRAHELLCQALDLWRGPALVGLPGRLVASAAGRWDDERLEAQELRMETELALGQPGRAAGEARALLDVNPYRQNLAGLLMRSLNHSGRAVEALSVYEALRDRLAEDLGIDPSRPLRELHLDILRQETAPARVPVPPAEPMKPVPSQLPAAVSGFTGRASQLAELDALLADRDAAVLATISGGGGVGKTALALHWAHRQIDRFPDGRLFIDLRGYDLGEPVAAQDALTRFLRALGVPAEGVPADTDEAAALYRSTLHDRRVLVILDNAASVGQVRPLLPGGSGSLVLVTSRDGLAGLFAMEGARPVSVDTLSRKESTDLLATLLGEARVRDELEAAQRLITQCGRLPLALRIIAANLVTWPDKSLSQAAAELDGGDRLAQLAVPGDPRAAVAGSIDLSYRSLEAATGEVFLHLGLIPGGDFPVSLAVATTGLPESEAGRHLQLLLSAHLVERAAGSRLRLHDLVGLYARRRAEAELPEARRAAAVERLLEWWHDREDITEYDNRAATITALADHPRVWRAAKPLDGNVHEGRNPAGIRELARIGLAAADTVDDHYGQSVMRNLIAGTHWVAREMPEAIEAGEAALRAARLAGNEAIVSRQLAVMAVFTQLQGDQLAAKAVLLEALDLCERSGQSGQTASRLGSLGAVCTALGEYDEAEAHLRRGLELAPEASDQLADIHNRMAILSMERGHHDEGLGWVETALSPPNAPRRHASLGVRARLLLAADRIAEAGETLAMLAEEFGDHPQQSSWLELSAIYHCERGEFSEALRFGLEFLGTAKQAGTDFHLAHAELVMAYVRNRRGEFRTALRHAATAEAVFVRMAGPLRQARALREMATAHDGLGEPGTAEEHRRRAEEILAELGADPAFRIA